MSRKSISSSLDETGSFVVALLLQMAESPSFLVRIESGLVLWTDDMSVERESEWGFETKGLWFL